MDSSPENSPAIERSQPVKRDFTWVYDLLLVVILLAAAYFRFTGLDWDEGTYLHPDERFLAMVETSIQPVGSFSEYFATQTSTLNPNNMGHGFFVYGTLPIFFVRYVLEWADKVGYGQVSEFGRPLAGLFDLLTILMLYLAASRLYNRRVGLLAAAFSAFAVLQIQLSHFFTVDIFLNFFIWAAIYFGALVATGRDRKAVEPEPVEHNLSRLALKGLRQIWTHPLLLPTLMFGLMTGMAMASKVNGGLIALMLPVAGAMHLGRMPAEKRTRAGVELLEMMALAGVLAAVTFRLFQPYAFSGPGFFGLGLNETWLGNLGSLRDLVVPSNGYPPSVQWFNRPPWFSGWNMTVWGLGLPLGLAAWAGVAWMGWRIFKGEWHKHLLAWGWVVGYFLWQSMAHNPTMRYQLPIYPGMALMAAWSLSSLFDGWKGSAFRSRQSGLLARLHRPLALGFGLLVLGGTLAYALAFLSIYQRDVTRIAASHWIYRNVPGAISLQIDTQEGPFSQQLSFPNGFAIQPGESYRTSFIPKIGGRLDELVVPHLSLVGNTPQEAGLLLTIREDSQDADVLASALVRSNFVLDSQAGNDIYAFNFSTPLDVSAGRPYVVQIDLQEGQGMMDLCQPLSILVFNADGGQEIALPTPENCTLSAGQPYSSVFTPGIDGSIPNVILAQPLNYRFPAQDETLAMVISDQPYGEPLGQAGLLISGRSDDLHFELDPPVQLDPERTYFIEVTTSGGLASLAGTIMGQETSWDDPLPMRVDGYDGYGGIYQGDHNMELYWEDNADKLERISGILDEVDMIPISSSRQWASLTRLPDRWPLVQAYYRLLLGCPEGRTVEWCYNVAEPGMFEGQLGFELVRTFQSDPTLLGLSVNDQFSEEAFTVYDHPKVFIFSKSDAYNGEAVRSLLSAALENGGQQGGVGGGLTKSLLLPDDRRLEQTQAGTWSSLFNTDSLINRFQPLTVLIWYLAVALVGLAAYPILRAVFPGLPDRGYPQSRAAGLLLVSYATWMAGSSGVEASRTVIGLVLLAVISLGGLFAFFQRRQIAEEFRRRSRYFILVEVLTLAFFLLMLMIRLGNPDLWHPWKGGEKPMDFAYFNAVLKSEQYPPFDPWFAGGYINYYYFGFVFAGTLVKFLGIVPAIAYNLILPTLFSLVAMAAFSLAWNMVQAVRGRWQSSRAAPMPEGGSPDAALQEQLAGKVEEQEEPSTLPYLAGLAASIGVTVLGNLGTLEMIYQGYQRIAAPPDAVLEETFFLTRWIWGFQGLVQALTSNVNLPYGLADWYWNPSRVIKAPGEIEPITEFPFFTFVYGDMHAHMFALPLALLALTWALAIVLGKGRWHNLLYGISAFIFGGLVIGALRPTNTWDYPTYLALGVLALAYAAFRHFRVPEGSSFASLPGGVVSALAAVGGAIWLLGLSWFLYQPFTRWYALGYTDIQPWAGTHTPIGDYLIHWGVFLFVIVSWMAWETRQWLEGVPAVAGLRFLGRIQWVIFAGGLFLVLWIAWLWTLNVAVSWFVVPLAAWAAVLLLRPGLPDAKRVVLFLFGTGMFLTLMVETIVLAGDLARMNTVFKFYLQVWILFGVCAGAAFGWLLPALRAWMPAWAAGWRLALVALVFSAALYPLLGGLAKIDDRMSAGAPITLDGMAYMPYSTYFDQGRELNLDEDYQAIRWMQENVRGTPVIVEAQVVEYRWGSRFSVYTGLPAVLGWNWHQRQQRTGHDMDVWDRAAEVEAFYRTTDAVLARSFLERYDVGYIVLGQLEHAYYDGEGMAKFAALDGQLWREVFHEGETVIYQVSPQVVSQ